MVTESGYGIEIIADKLPIIPEAMANIAPSVGYAAQDILFCSANIRRSLYMRRIPSDTSLLFELKKRLAQPS